MLSITSVSFSQSNKRIDNQYNKPQFSLAGQLVGSLQSWSELNTSESKLGFGASADLYAGIIFDDMYLGIGPHFGYNCWTLSESYGGQTATATTSMQDVGWQVIGAWDHMYLTVGMGTGKASISASGGGQTATLDIPGSPKYNRVGIGYFDGYTIGIAVVSYDGAFKNFGRTEFNIGWAF